MSLFAMFKSAGPTGFGYGSTAEQVTEGLSLAGQTILVTGCNSGIGQEACRVISIDVGSSNRKSEGGADIEHGDFFEDCILANVLWTQRTGVPADPSPRAPPHTLLSVKQLFE